MVKEEISTAKVKVVFDVLAKIKVGPTIQDYTFSILLTFSKHRFISRAGITKVYRQVNVGPEKFTKNSLKGNPEKELRKYSAEHGYLRDIISSAFKDKMLADSI